MNPIRHGDVNLIPITEEEYNKAQGKAIKHNGSFVLAEGEATGSVHTISVNDPKNLEIKVNEMAQRFISVQEEATLTHTVDHETIIVPAKRFYVQVQEREIDWFAEGVARNVID